MACHVHSFGIVFVKWFDPSLCQFGTVQKHLVDVLPKVTCLNDLGAKLHYLLVHVPKIKHVEEITQEPTKKQFQHYFLSSWPHQNGNIFFPKVSLDQAHPPWPTTDSTPPGSTVDLPAKAIIVTP